MALSPIRVLSLFSGGGGLDRGFHAATGGRSRTVCYVEREAYAAACLVARMEEAALDAAPVWDDVATFDGRAWRGAVDCVLGGSPCQDLSVAGKRAGIHGERSGLFWHQLRIAVECEAPIFAWENVGGAASALSVVESALAEAGYRGASVSIRASDVGAPHRRQRIFLLAYRDGSLLRQQQGRECWASGSDSTKPSLHGGDAAYRDAAVADAQRERRKVALQSVRFGSSPNGIREASVIGVPCHGLADSCGAGLQGREWPGAPREDAGAPRPATECGGPAWPPGPDDAEGWRDYRDAGGPAPVESRFRRGADGVACGCLNAVWADRLRLLGNGVVPQQAEAAFRFLIQHLETT